MFEFNVQSNKNSDFLLDSLDAIREGKVDWLMLEGSSRSGKTWAILFFLISLALDPSAVNRKRLVIRCFRHNATTNAKTIVADFLHIMQNEISYEESGKFYSLFNSVGKWNKSTKTYAFFNGSTISFEGADDPQKLQGAKQDIAWFNEAMEIIPDSMAQISMRTTLLKIADWNPSLTSHWAFQIIERNIGVRYCHSTYKDNFDRKTGKSNIEPAIVSEIEALDPSKPENIRAGTADPYKWDVYGLGKRGAREGQVFPRIHWDVIDDKDFPPQAVCQRYGYGGDFGFSQDPTAFIDCRFHNDALYVKQLVYEQNLFIGKNSQDPLIPSLELRLEELERDPKFSFNRLSKQVWDCSDPRSIEVLRALGYNAHPCVKGADSVLYGINLMKQYRIFICRSSQKVQIEFENYCWKKRPDGTFSDIPEDANNHAIDAIRYWVMDALKPRRTDIGNGRRRQPARSLFDEF